jgi:AhpD family alkylhydroperoxidase
MKGEHMNNREPRYFSKRTFIKCVFEAAHMIVKYHGALQSIDKKLKANVMLAVTYVNGCSLCSHHHAKELIKAGATKEELSSMLDGTFSKVDPDDMLAVTFAEHYADAGGAYEPETFEKVKEVYGEKKAYGILASIRVIMFGNMSGISIGNLGSWIRFKRPPNARFLTDLHNVISPVLWMPLFLFINLFRKKRKD